MTWTKQQVLAASDAWRWVPPEAATYDIDGVQVIDYPEWAFTGFYVTPLDTRRPVADLPSLIESICADARTRGKTTTTWWISPATSPDGFGHALAAAGGRLTETADIYAFDMTDSLPAVGDTSGVRTELVVDERTLDDFRMVAEAVWQDPPQTAERRASLLAEVSRPIAETHECRVVAYDGDAPVAMGGMQVVDGVCRLWGAATLESERGRGAYRAVLLRRLQEARALGATLALVHARIGTSGPIVARCGFTSYGRGYSYELPLEPVAP
ncbi:GNAT family N-acetyltransferase [Flexivirga sp. B27]